MKVVKILYWILFALGAGLFVLNMFLPNPAITISSIIALILAIILYFVYTNLKKKVDQMPPISQRNVDLNKQREDSYKRIREEKKAKKNQK